MRRLFTKILEFHRDTDGPTSVEYAVMLAMILGVCMLTVQQLAKKTGDSFDNSSQAISNAL